MAGATVETTLDAAASALSLEEQIKALQLEKQRMELAMVTLRTDFDEYRKQTENEKQRWMMEKDQVLSSFKEILMQQVNKNMVSKSEVGTEASTADIEEQEELCLESSKDPLGEALFQKRKGLVQQTWKTIQESLNVEATRLFYKHLFERYPQLAPLFKNADIEIQAAMLYQALAMAVESLDDLDALVPILEELGAKHATSFKVERWHYDAVGECLFSTLKTGLNDIWTEEMAEAWVWCYGVISKTMADAGDQALVQRHKSIVQKTWQDVENSLNVEATKLFYKRLFETHPTVVPLFAKGDIEVQAAKLYQTLCMAVEALNNMDALIPTLEELGTRHALQFGTEQAHYDAMGECLLWTLKVGLGSAWTDKVADAWSWCYGVISKTMVEAGDRARLGAAANNHQKVSKLSAKQAKETSLSNLDLVKKSLYELRLETDNKIRRLDAENRRLQEENERLVTNMREMLVIQSKIPTRRSERQDTKAEIVFEELALKNPFVTREEGNEKELVLVDELNVMDRALTKDRRKTLVRKTWKTVQVALNVDATKIFYQQLFQKFPSVVPLFGKVDIEIQAAKLYQMLSLAVESLDDFDSFIPTLDELGARHAISFQTERAHYDAVGECLLSTLKACLADAWTEDVADAWAWCYGLISKVMADAGDKVLIERRKLIVQKTWKEVENSLNLESTRLFYKRLFETHPTVVPLFAKGDIELQAAKLYQTLCLAVEALDDLENLIPKLEELGERHALLFETERVHYHAFGECLLWTLKAAFGESWTDAVADAWTWVYQIISQTMADAGEKARLVAHGHPASTVSDDHHKVQQLETALCNLRLQYEEKIRFLEQQNECLVKEKENALSSAHDILASSVKVPRVE